jgi:hypothetical protein
MRPTSSGASLPSSVALAAEVMKSEVFQTAISSTKKMPAAAASAHKRQSRTTLRRATLRANGSASTTAAIATR